MSLTAFSPHGGPVEERQKLSDRFVSRLKTNNFFNRKIVSYQGNRKSPGWRWMKYKEGFSSQLVIHFINEEMPRNVLDPFAGICTTPLIAAGKGCSATGIEIMPVGVLTGSAIAEVANGLSKEEFYKHSSDLLHSLHQSNPPSEYAFQHVRITNGAFTKKTEHEIANARRYIRSIRNFGLRQIFDLACISVLEESSFTRKDGQYLRWDKRANRPLRSSIDLGYIPPFSVALTKRLKEIGEDIDHVKNQFGGNQPTLITGSCLEMLKDIPDHEFDMVITSPPYANRYDYTRTYALELAWMGFDQDRFSELRQRMLSATVENRTKKKKLAEIYCEKGNVFHQAEQNFKEQGAVQEVLKILIEKQSELSNRSILRLIEQYFFEMSVVVAELGRVVRPRGAVYMVNDNVQYHGEELPVDFILADFAEKSGFHCETIWKLAKGKGNSSQQMARYGRRELRKCVYKWVRRSE